jgi:endoglucanase
MRATVTIALLLAACGSGSSPGSPDAGEEVDLPDAATPNPDDPDAAPIDPPGGAWLHTEGNRIRRADGAVWQGRGANLHDTRGCNACTWGPPDPDEVMRRVDELVDVWGADFIRLTLESYASDEGRVHWRGLLDDADYLEDVRAIVDHIGTKPGVYVLVSLWIDPTFSDMGWPTTGTHAVWERLAETFAGDAHVLFGLVNEPQYNYDGALDEEVWAAMNDTVAAIRAVEDDAGAPYHVITVQGTGGWARFLDYYTTHPITAGGGANVAYEVHVYDPESTFGDRFIDPSQTIPVVIGEFGPAADMTLDDCATLMDEADSLGVPYLAWTFHMRCPPNLIVDQSQGGCGIDMPLEPTTWGQLLRDRLAP